MYIINWCIIIYTHTFILMFSFNSKKYSRIPLIARFDSRLSIENWCTFSENQYKLKTKHDIIILCCGLKPIINLNT